MTLDLSKPLSTRDGRSVEIITTKGRGSYSIVGYIGSYNGVSTWTDTGVKSETYKDERNHDLINIPEPKRSGEVWVEIRESKAGDIYVVASTIPFWSSGIKVLARFSRKWTEGEGLEGG